MTLAFKTSKEQSEKREENGPSVDDEKSSSSLNSSFERIEGGPIAVASFQPKPAHVFEVVSPRDQVAQPKGVLE